MLSSEAFVELASKYSNWGRWGKQDQVGTLNYITKDELVASASEVKKGKVFSLAIPLDSKGPQTGYLGRFNPIHLMIRHGGDAVLGHQSEVHSADDFVLMALQSATHWDSLAHVFFQGKMYNGFSMGEVTGTGAAKNSIDRLGGKVLGRGVLLDIARLKGRGPLEDGYGITGDDLEAAAKVEKVKVRQGDTLLVRTGKLGISKRRGDWEKWRTPGIAGLSLSTLEWISEHKLAAVASDNWAVEVVPYETEKVLLPFHIAAVMYMGLTLGEVFDLDALAMDCAEDGKYSFLFSAVPLPLAGAVGSPINPVAVK